VTPRWAQIAFLIFGLIWLAFGTIKLTRGESAMGGADLVLGVGWLLVVAYNRSNRTAGTSSHSRDDSTTPSSRSL